MRLPATAPDEVRRESQALRAEAERLRRDARKHRRLSGRRLHACLLAYERTAELRAETRRSPWSDIEWEPVAAANLDHVLVLL